MQTACKLVWEGHEFTRADKSLSSHWRFSA